MGKMTAVHKPIMVYVRGPLVATEAVQTVHGFVEASVGDLVLTDMESGEEWPIRPDVFARFYDVVDPTVDQERHSAHNIGEFELMKREDVLAGRAT